METRASLGRVRSFAGRKVPRIAAGIALAVALVAIPALQPDAADAKEMSQGMANGLCRKARGSMHYEFYYSMDDSRFDMTCTLPSGANFFCVVSGSPVGNTVDCY